jgi:hypothetical protein
MRLSFLICGSPVNGLHLVLPVIFQVLVPHQLLEVVRVFELQVHWHRHYFIYLIVIHFLSLQIEIFNLWFFIIIIYNTTRSSWSPFISFNFSDNGRTSAISPVSNSDFPSVRVVKLLGDVFINIWILLEIGVKLIVSLFWSRYVFLGHFWSLDYYQI